jgi:hypothetical protein
MSQLTEEATILLLELVGEARENLRELLEGQFELDDDCNPEFNPELIDSLNQQLVDLREVELMLTSE